MGERTEEGLREYYSVDALVKRMNLTKETLSRMILAINEDQLTFICGGPGEGKTTVAKTIALAREKDTKRMNPVVLSKFEHDEYGDFDLFPLRAYDSDGVRKLFEEWADNKFLVVDCDFGEKPISEEEDEYQRTCLDTLTTALAHNIPCVVTLMYRRKLEGPVADPFTNSFYALTSKMPLNMIWLKEGKKDTGN